MIELSNVRKTYGRTPALSGFSLKLQPGGLGVLRGANGSGKSTALKIVAGIALADQGSRCINARVIGYSGHRDQLPASVRVMDSLKMQVGLFTRDQSQLYVIAEQLGINRFWHKRPGQLSQGMRQRVKLVRAFAVGADLLVLDEPQVGLDGAGVQTFFDLLRKHIQIGGTTLMATHLDLPDLGVLVQEQCLDS